MWLASAHGSVVCIGRSTGGGVGENVTSGQALIFQEQLKSAEKSTRADEIPDSPDKGNHSAFTAVSPLSSNHSRPCPSMASPSCTNIS